MESRFGGTKCLNFVLIKRILIVLEKLFVLCTSKNRVTEKIPTPSLHGPFGC